MRNTFSVLALVFCGLWGASQAMASTSFCDAISGNLVLNCGFETGDFTSWTIGGSTDNPGGNYYGVDAFDANSGSFGAYMSQDLVDDGTAPVTLSQTLATAPGGVYLVEFWLEQDTAPTLGYTHAFSASWGGTTIQTLTPTVALPGPVGVFEEYTFMETATTASTLLSFSFENDDSYWSFDDVSASAVPESSSGLLAGMALCALFLGWKQLKRATSI
ncbi:MAG: hypothetical protein ABSF12_08795 [Bryobacteraceae bacterium]|jgi:hypothetical protein